MEKVILAAAIAFAAEKHMNQERKDGSPYIYHPLRVAEMVREAGYPIKYQVVALLHDTLEDTDATENDIEYFGDDVLKSVKLLTKPDGADEADYVAGILSDHMASVVKNADKIDNILDYVMLDGFGNRRTEENALAARAYIKKAKEYYYGKFSKTLDDVINVESWRICDMKVVEKYTVNYASKDMQLISDVKKKAREKNYDYFMNQYNECTELPDFSDKDTRIWYHEMLHFYYCVNGEKVWRLTPGGWLPTDYRKWYDTIYVEDFDYFYPEKRNELAEVIKDKIAEDYFYDFVDLSKLC